MSSAAPKVEVAPLFATPIAVVDIPGAAALNAELKAVILAHEKGTPSTQHSNLGGWQSSWDMERWGGGATARLLDVARGVANGVFWGLTPTVGLQTLEITATWFVGRKAFRRDSSLLQAYIWVWINNPVTMVPMYYAFYVTGLWLTGDGSRSRGYDGFVELWTRAAALSWWQGLTTVVQAIGLPLFLGAVPYAVVGTALAYRWALSVVRHRRPHAHPWAGPAHRRLRARAHHRLRGADGAHGGGHRGVASVPGRARRAQRSEAPCQPRATHPRGWGRNRTRLR